MNYAENQARAHVNFTVYDINCAEIWFSKCSYYKGYYNVCQLFCPILAEVGFSFAEHMRDKAHDLIPHMADTAV